MLLQKTLNPLSYIVSNLFRNYKFNFDFSKLYFYILSYCCVILHSYIYIHLLTGGAKTLLGKVWLAVRKILAILLICTCAISFSAEREVIMTKTNDVTTQSTVTKISVAANLTFP